jgi:ubiquinone/menaquinone biosynthesis C-methylase UbiE
VQFAEKIVGIKEGDRVLEVGPGGNPFHRADIFLELQLNDAELAAQRGHSERVDIEPSRVIYYDGKKFPFRDKEFDYVICSHVIEHVPDVKNFMNEIFRVAKMGYIEYPTIYYEYLYNFDVHINFIKTDNKANTLYFLPKSKTSFHDFKDVQKFFYESLVQGYAGLIEDLHEFMFEGFEWHEPFNVKAANGVSQIVLQNPQIHPKGSPNNDTSIRETTRILYRKVGAGIEGSITRTPHLMKPSPKICVIDISTCFTFSLTNSFT